ncbi:MAG: putative Ig domain-containing protein, partial [Thermacetogeniaceae bacterium]
DTVSYTDNVANTVTSVTVTPTAADATATIKVNGTTVANGTASGPISLNVGSNIIKVRVNAHKGAPRTYTITVTRAKSSIADLSNLTISAGTLTPTFATGTLSYTDSVANSVTSVTVTPTAADTTATVRVNGAPVASGAASGPISLIVGSNTISVVVTAQDGTTIKAYTITATRMGRLQITSTSLPAATQGVFYSYILAATGGDGNYTWSATGLPGGLSINTSTGSITGTPSTATGSPFSVAISVHDNSGSTATKNLSLIVHPQLTITTAGLPNATVGKFYWVFVTASGGLRPYRWSATGLPAGLHINTHIGLITGWPSTTSGSPASVTITVTDKNGNTATRSFSLAVYPLQITTTSLPNAAQGVHYSATVSASGGLTPYTWSATGLPAGLSINASTGAITGTPSTTSGSPFTVTVKVTDANNINASRNLSLAVAGDNTPPSLSVDQPVDGSYVNTNSIAVSGTASDAGSGLAGVNVNGINAYVDNNGNFSCTVGGLTTGANTITVTATDNAGNSTTVSRTIRLATITITDNSGQVTGSFSGSNNVVNVTVSGLDPNLAPNYYYIEYKDPGTFTYGDLGVWNSGNLTSSYNLNQNIGQPGTWTVDVHEDDSNGHIVAQVTSATFEVEDSAIPEFPTPVAAILVLGMCAAGYAWFRKRYGEKLA